MGQRDFAEKALHGRSDLENPTHYRPIAKPSHTSPVRGSPSEAQRFLGRLPLSNDRSRLIR